MKFLQPSIWFLLISIAPACAQQSLDEKLKHMYRYTVPLIQPEQLVEWQGHNIGIVILDTRSPREFEVSHIQGAQMINYQTFDKQQVSDLPKNQKVVVYCSVGYRSERIGEQLQELGFQEVYNLYGGIIQWKNQGNQVVDLSGQPTEKVHAYNKQWGQWLKSGIKVYE